MQKIVRRNDYTFPLEFLCPEKKSGSKEQFIFVEVEFR